MEKVGATGGESARPWPRSVCPPLFACLLFPRPALTFPNSPLSFVIHLPLSVGLFPLAYKHASPILKENVDPLPPSATAPFLCSSSQGNSRKNCLHSAPLLPSAQPSPTWLLPTIPQTSLRSQSPMASTLSNLTVTLWFPTSANQQQQHLTAPSTPSFLPSGTPPSPGFPLASRLRPSQHFCRFCLIISQSQGSASYAGGTQSLCTSGPRL